MSASLNCLIPRVGVISVASPLEVGADRAAGIAGDLARLLESSGCQVVSLGVVDTPDRAVVAGRKAAELHLDAVAVAVACWFEDYLVIDLLEECLVPVLTWSVPGMETGALCGSMQLTAYLKQLDRPYHSIYGTIEQGAYADRAMSFLRAASLGKLLRRARIGIAGHRVAGMTHTSPNEFGLKKAVGPRVVPLDIDDILEKAGQIPESTAQAAWNDVRGRAGACSVSDSDGLESIRNYLALKECVNKNGLQALSVGCYPNLMGKVCLAASLLADDGIPLACEGDVNGAVCQLILTKLTGQPTHNTDWLEPLEDGTLILTHCGSGSFRLAESFSDIMLGPVRLMSQGVCATFPAKPGPVTLIGLTPSVDGYMCSLLEGEAHSGQMVFPGNPLRVRFDKPVGDLIEWIHSEGIGHHWMAGYGHVAGAIRDWAAMAGASLRLLEP